MTAIDPLAGGGEPLPDEEASDGGRAGPRSVARTLEILRALADSPDGRSLAELTVGLGAPKSSILMLLKSLDATGYVTGEAGRYRLGPEAYGLAQAVTKTIRFPSVLVPSLERVAGRCGETALIAALADDDAFVTYLEVRDGERALRLHARPGDRAPVNGVVVGHVILAFLPQARARALLDKARFDKPTRFALSRRELEARLSTIREQGCAVGIGGQFDDVMGVAAPVFDATGAVRCAVAVGGPIERIRAREAQMRDGVVAGAREMSRILGFDGRRPPP